jgi:hypothetical protein
LGVFINDDRIDLLVIGSICDAQPCLLSVLAMDVAEVPGYKALPLIGVMLLVIRLGNVCFDSVVHAYSP